MGQYITMLSIIISFVFVSCDNNQTDKWIKKKLEGDWIIPLDDQTSSFISFKDSMALCFYDSDYRPYFIKKDTIIIKASEHPYRIKLPFSKVTDKYLWLKGSTPDEIRPCPSANNFYNNQLVLKEIEVRFTLQGFNSYLSWFLTIKDTKESFLKIRYNKKVNFGITKFFDKGIYYSKLNDEEFKFIQNKFRNVAVSELNHFYESDFGPMDGSPTLINILIRYCYTYDDKINTINIYSRGFESMPIRFGVLIKYLHQMYYFAKYEPTNSTHNFMLETEQQPSL